MIASPTMTICSLIRLCFARWSRLGAWGVCLADVPLELVLWKRWQTNGTTFNHKLSIRLRVGRDLGDALATLLHELAHAAAYRRTRGHPNRRNAWNHHGPLWCGFYIAAVEEITGHLPVPLEQTAAHIDFAVAGLLRAQMRAWGGPSPPLWRQA